MQQDLTCSLPLWKNYEAPSNQLSPIENFTCFFDDFLFQELVDFSNLYASQKNRLVDPITTDEMKCFIGAILLSGYNSFPRRCVYGKTIAISKIGLYILQFLGTASNATFSLQ